VQILISDSEVKRDRYIKQSLPKRYQNVADLCIM